MNTSPSTLRICPPGGNPVEFLIEGRFVPRERLGAGGCGEAWLALDLVAEVPVVLKGIRHELIDQLPQAARVALLLQFRQESAVLLKLPRSPNLLAMYSVLEYDGLPYVVTEFLPHGSLAAYCGVRVPLGLQIGWLRDISYGLADAAAAKILHRDVKPENIVLRNETCAVLVDFGLALAIEDADESWVFGGTREYAAPEVNSEGLAAASERSDLFSFGLTALQLLTGSFYRAPTGGVRYDKARLTNSKLRSVVAACLATRPAERPSGFAEVAACLDGLVPTVPGMTSRTTVLPSLPEIDSYATALARIDPKRALDLLGQAAAAEPVSSRSTGNADVNRSHILAEILNNPKDALPAAETAIKRSAPDSFVRFHAHMSAANCLRLLDRPEEALAHCDDAARIPLKQWQSGDGYLVFLNRAMALIALGRVNEAFMLADNSRNTYPTESRLDLLIGTWLMGNHQFTQAESFLRRAAELNPTDLPSAVNYASCLKEVNQIPEALQWLETACQIAPDDPDVLTLLVNIHGNAGDVFRAAELLPDAIRTNPDDAMFREWGRTILKLGWQSVLEGTSGMREAYRAMRAFDRLRQVLNEKP